MSLQALGGVGSEGHFRRVLLVQCRGGEDLAAREEARRAPLGAQAGAEAGGGRAHRVCFYGTVRGGVGGAGRGRRRAIGDSPPLNTACDLSILPRVDGVGAVPLIPGL